MNPFKKSFDENYISVKKACNNKNGYKIEHVYYGPWYFWDEPAKSLTWRKISIGAACALDICVFFFAATTESILNYLLFVEVFGTLSLIGLLFQTIGTAQFCTSKNPMTRLRYNSVNTKLRLAPIYRAIFSLLAGISGAYYMSFLEFEEISLFVSSGYFVSSALSVFIYVKFRALPFTSRRNNVLEEYKSQLADGTILKPPSK